MALSETEGSGTGSSDLDQNTHAELRLLYKDSTTSIRFARDRQWRLVGGALLLYAALVAVPELLEISTMAVKGLVLASLLIDASTIYILIVYQVWQTTELRRMQSIAAHFSLTFAQLGGQEAAREGKLHGYIILFFMIAAVALGNALAALLLSRFYLL